LEETYFHSFLQQWLAAEVFVIHDLDHAPAFVIYAMWNMPLHLQFMPRGVCPQVFACQYFGF
jgi:hypothetical protein